MGQGLGRLWVPEFGGTGPSTAPFALRSWGGPKKRKRGAAETLIAAE
jgi:hypothetical protein